MAVHVPVLWPVCAHTIPFRMLVYLAIHDNLNFFHYICNLTRRDKRRRDETREDERGETRQDKRRRKRRDKRREEFKRADKRQDEK